MTPMVAGPVVVVGAAVMWNVEYGNLPAPVFLLERPLPVHGSMVFHRFPGDGGSFYIARTEPLVRFVFESDNGGGGLGDPMFVAGEGIYKPNGGWSSSSPAVNQLRAREPAVTWLLPEDVVEASCWTQTWDTTGNAGCSFDVPFVREVLGRFCPGVELAAVSHPASAQLDAVQATVASGPERGALWTPWPAGSLWTKPSPSSEVYKRTAAEPIFAAVSRRRQLEAKARTETLVASRARVSSRCPDCGLEWNGDECPQCGLRQTDIDYRKGQ